MNTMSVSSISPAIHAEKKSDSDEKRVSQTSESLGSFSSNFTLLNELVNLFESKITLYANTQFNGDNRAKHTLKYFTECSDSDVSPLRRLINPFVKCLKKEHILKTSDSLIKVLEICSERLFDQEMENLEHYVSHGFNHAQNVAHYIEQIVKSQLAFGGKTLLDQIGNRYKIGPRRAQLVLNMLGMLHDCGYPKLQNRQKKAYHAVHGANLVDSLEMPFLNLFYNGSGKNPNPNDPYNLFKDFRQAIYFHCADSTEDSYDWRILVNRDEFLFKDQDYAQAMNRFIFSDASKINSVLMMRVQKKGRKLDDLTALRYRKVNVLKHPFDLILRFADNLDVTSERFSALQRTAAFQKIYRRAHSMYLEKQTIDYQLLQNDVSKELEELAETKADYRDQILKLLPNINQESLFHFGGCESIVSVTLEVKKSLISSEEMSGLPREIDDGEVDDPVDCDQNGDQITKNEKQAQFAYLSVVFDTKKYQELSRITTNNQISECFKNSEVFKGQVFISVAMYQIWRTMEAFRSLDFGFDSDTLMEKTSKTINIVTAFKG